MHLPSNEKTQILLMSPSEIHEPRILALVDCWLKEFFIVKENIITGISINTILAKMFFALFFLIFLSVVYLVFGSTKAAIKQ